MNVAKKDLGNQTALITVTVSAPDYAETVDKALKGYKKKANIPGFRPGMVPMALINKMYKKGITAEEAYKAASSACFNYVQENNIKTLGDPMPSKEQKELDFDNDTDFEFAFEIGIAPEVNIDLANLSLTKYKITIDEKMVQGYKDNYLRRYGKLVDVDVVEKEEAVSVNLDNGEMAIEDAYVGLIGMNDEERKPFIGKKVGDVMEVNVNELYKAPSQRAAILAVKEEELAAINPNFKLTITRLRKFENPEVNEEFFKEAFPQGDVTSVEQWEAKINDQIANDLARETDHKFIDDTKEALLKAADLKIPDQFLKEWLFGINEGKFTMEQIEAEYPQFATMISWDVIKRHYAALQKIEVTPEEAKEEAKALAMMQFAYYGMHNVEAEMLENYAGSIMGNKEEASKIFDKLAERKIIDYIADNAKVKNKKITTDEFAKFIPAAQ